MKNNRWIWFSLRKIFDFIDAHNGAMIAIGTVALAVVTFCHMQEAEKMRKETKRLADVTNDAFISGKTAQLQVKARRVIGAGVQLPARTDIQSSHDAPIGKQVEQGKVMGIDTQPSGDGMTITLIFRNTSIRPTAVIDLFVRGKNTETLGGPGYYNQIKLPIILKSWEVDIRNIQIKNMDEREIKDILIQDMDDKNLCVVPGKGWTEATSDCK